MTRPDFLDSPAAWTRSRSRPTDYATDACAIEHVERRTSAAATVIFCVVLALLGAALLVHYMTPCEAGALCAVILPAGCDQQGRYETRPHGPAEAATEVGADDDRLPMDGEWAEVGLGLLIASGIVTAAILIKVFA